MDLHEAHKPADIGSRRLLVEIPGMAGKSSCRPQLQMRTDEEELDFGVLPASTSTAGEPRARAR